MESHATPCQVGLPDPALCEAQPTTLTLATAAADVSVACEPSPKRLRPTLSLEGSATSLQAGDNKAAACKAVLQPPPDQQQTVRTCPPPLSTALPAWHGSRKSAPARSFPLNTHLARGPATAIASLLPPATSCRPACALRTAATLTPLTSASSPLTPAATPQLPAVVAACIAVLLLPQTGSQGASDVAMSAASALCPEHQLQQPARQPAPEAITAAPAVTAAPAITAAPALTASPSSSSSPPSALAACNPQGYSVLSAVPPTSPGATSLLCSSSRPLHAQPPALTAIPSPRLQPPAQLHSLSSAAAELSNAPAGASSSSTAVPAVARRDCKGATTMSEGAKVPCGIKVNSVNTARIVHTRSALHTARCPPATSGAPVLSACARPSAPSAPSAPPRAPSCTLLHAPIPVTRGCFGGNATSEAPTSSMSSTATAAALALSHPGPRPPARPPTAGGTGVPALASARGGGVLFPSTTSMDTCLPPSAPTCSTGPPFLFSATKTSGPTSASGRVADPTPSTSGRPHTHTPNPKPYPLKPLDKSEARLALMSLGLHRLALDAAMNDIPITVYVSEAGQDPWPGAKRLHRTVMTEAAVQDLGLLDVSGQCVVWAHRAAGSTCTGGAQRRRRTQGVPERPPLPDQSSGVLTLKAAVLPGTLYKLACLKDGLLAKLQAVNGNMTVVKRGGTKTVVGHKIWCGGLTNPRNTKYAPGCYAQKRRPVKLPPWAHEMLAATADPFITYFPDQARACWTPFYESPCGVTTWTMTKDYSSPLHLDQRDAPFGGVLWLQGEDKEVKGVGTVSTSAVKCSSTSRAGGRKRSAGDRGGDARAGCSNAGTSSLGIAACGASSAASAGSALTSSQAGAGDGARTAGEGDIGGAGAHASRAGLGARRSRRASSAGVATNNTAIGRGAGSKGSTEGASSSGAGASSTKGNTSGVGGGSGGSGAGSAGSTGVGPRSGNANGTRSTGGAGSAGSTGNGDCAGSAGSAGNGYFLVPSLGAMFRPTHGNALAFDASTLVHGTAPCQPGPRPHPLIGVAVYRRRDVAEGMTAFGDLVVDVMQGLRKDLRNGVIAKRQLRLVGSHAKRAEAAAADRAATSTSSSDLE